MEINVLQQDSELNAGNVTIAPYDIRNGLAGLCAEMQKNFSSFVLYSRPGHPRTIDNNVIAFKAALLEGETFFARLVPGKLKVPIVRILQDACDFLLVYLFGF
jgi:hypothetical protein